MKLPPGIGLPTDARYRLPLAAALERIAGRAELAEIYSADEHTLLAGANRRAAVASGLQLTVHGPYDDLEPGSPGSVTGGTPSRSIGGILRRPRRSGRSPAWCTPTTAAVPSPATSASSTQ